MMPPETVLHDLILHVLSSHTLELLPNGERPCIFGYGSGKSPACELSPWGAGSAVEARSVEPKGTSTNSWLSGLVSLN